MTLRMDDEALHAKYTELLNKSLTEADAAADTVQISTVLMHVRADVEQAAGELRTHAFGCAEAAPTARWREEKKLARAMDRYIKAKSVLNHMEKLIGHSK